MASLQERDGRWQCQFLYRGKRRTFALTKKGTRICPKGHQFSEFVENVDNVTSLLTRKLGI
jgi:hypothetical protein